jgi:RHS repeat-associated protein
MNKDGVVYYLHADHLGSTSLATNESGQEVTGSRTLYYPYGEERWSASGGTLPTDYTFTGQRADAGTGLMDYNARYYDAALGRFVQADTIVPSPGDPQSLNRYSYVAGNPLKYTDPTGHMVKPPQRHPISIDISTWNPKLVQALDVVQEATRTVAELPAIIAPPSCFWCEIICQKRAGRRRSGDYGRR